MNKNIREIINTIIYYTIMVFIGVALAFSLHKCHSKTNTTTSPVEGNRIDSITKENDKLIIEVEYLDSIKDAKIIEVKSLDNDSTLRLFYQLIGK